MKTKKTYLFISFILIVFVLFLSACSNNSANKTIPDSMQSVESISGFLKGISGEWTGNYSSKNGDKCVNEYTFKSDGTIIVYVGFANSEWTLYGEGNYKLNGDKIEINHNLSTVSNNSNVGNYNYTILVSSASDNSMSWKIIDGNCLPNVNMELTRRDAVSKSIEETEKATEKETVIETQIEEVETSVIENNSVDIYSKLSEPFIFSSGAGFWSTTLQIYGDGSFSGKYQNSIMSERSDDYPNGTKYYCEFYGQFSFLEIINEYTYSMKVSSLEYNNELDTEEIKDGTLYKYTNAKGIENGDTFYIYSPDSPVDKLPSEFIDWANKMNPPKDDILGYYALYNVDLKDGFVSQNK